MCSPISKALKVLLHRSGDGRAIEAKLLKVHPGIHRQIVRTEI